LQGKTALLVALLKGLGIAARPVFVDTDSGDAVARRLPAMNLFDHVLVEAQIGGRSYWLDGTRRAIPASTGWKCPTITAACPPPRRAASWWRWCRRRRARRWWKPGWT
jgi:hypothetical protein